MFRRRSLRIEPMEARRVLDARVVISEVVASNEQGLEDANDDRWDWIELANTGDEAVELGGWHLTDDAQNLTKWTFPDITLKPDRFLVVFASGHDQRPIVGELHTNFRLNADGEYLGLIEPDGTSVASEFAPTFPPLMADRSFGLPQGSEERTVADPQRGLRVLIPSEDNGGDTLGLKWTEPEFDDSQWIAGTGGVGFGESFDALIGLNVESQAKRVNATLLTRIPFQLDEPDLYFGGTFRIQYNDGYVAYLNGHEIAKANAPRQPDWDSGAIRSRQATESMVVEEIDITDDLHWLRAGNNVLSIHGMNRSRNSSDMLVVPTLSLDRPAPMSDAAAGYFAKTTPGQPNGLDTFVGLMPALDISVERGFYESPFETTVSAEYPGATLVYTTDGSTPTMDNGQQVVPSKPEQHPAVTLAIAQTTTLRAAAFKQGFLSSRIATHTYLFLDDVIRQDVQQSLDAGFPERWRSTTSDYGMDPDVVGPNDLFDGLYRNQITDALLSVPTVSLVFDNQHLFGTDRGIYVNSVQSGPEWERPTSVELIHPDGSEGFQELAGIRIQGDNVRNLNGSKKQSFRLEFREAYGATKLRYPVFGDEGAERFDTLVLRGLYNDRWTTANAQYLRDEWARRTLNDMGQPNSHGTWVHLYLNGFYWGLYNLIERPNASFAASYFDGNKNEWDALNSGNVRDGNGDAWRVTRTVAADVRSDDVRASNAAYLRLMGRSPDGVRDPETEILLDVDNYIDYLIVNFYGGNNDWPMKNYYIGRRRGPESTGFKFFAWDTEKILNHGGQSTLDGDATNAVSGVAELYRHLRTNAEFRLRFADRVHQHFFNGGALYVHPEVSDWDPEHPGNNLPAARYDAIAAGIEQAMIGESARWGDMGGGDNPRTQADWQATRDQLNEGYFPQRSNIVIEQFINAGLYPAVAAPVFSQHGGFIDAGAPLTINAPGDVYLTLDGTDPRQSPLDPGIDEAGVAATAQRYRGPIPLTGNVVVKARTLVDGQWSALNEATFSQDYSSLRIAEVMYHPRDARGEGNWADNDFEFIELVNISKTTPVNLQGVRLQDAVEFEFDATVLQPGERTVVVRNVAAFQQRYGTDISIAGEYTPDFALSNSQETLRMDDPFGRVIQQLTYSDDWIESTDGQGHSLTIVSPKADAATLDSAAGWRASRAIDGSPGTDDTGDFNGDGLTDADDVDLYCIAHRDQDLRFDLNADGQLNEGDLGVLFQDVLNTSFGDANLDGQFDINDLNRFFDRIEYDDTIPGNSTWSEGDWNCDGDFNGDDLLFALAEGSFVGPPTAQANTPSNSELAAAVDGLFGSASEQRKPAGT